MTPSLSVTNWANIIGYSPWQALGWNVSPQGIPNTPCLNPIPKYNWQNADFVGRAEIVNAIENAESILARYLGFAPAPRYDEQEIVGAPVSGYAGWGWNWGWGAGSNWSGGQYPAVQTDEGWVQSLGTELLTLISANVTIAYTDKDGDGTDDTFTIGPIATSETDPLVFRVYNSAADRWDGSGVGEQWAISPIRVTLAGGFVTISGPAWLCAKPVLYERLNWTISGLEPDVPSNFVSTFDIYTSTTNTSGTTNPTAEALLVWENSPWTWCCGPAPQSPTADPQALAYGFARGGVRASRNAWTYEVYSVYNSTTQTWSAAWWLTCSPPSRIIVRYLAGLDVERNSYSPYYGQMKREYQTVVARLAAAQLTRPPAGCESAATRELAYWQLDTAQVRGNGNEIYSTTRRQLDNPIGSRRGEIAAWNFIQNAERGIGVTVS